MVEWSMATVLKTVGVLKSLRGFESYCSRQFLGNVTEWFKVDVC